MYIVKNLTEGNVQLIEGSINLEGKSKGPASRARLPDFARNHDDIKHFEGEFIEVIPAEKSDKKDGTSDTPDDEDEDTPDEDVSTESTNDEKPEDENSVESTKEDEKEKTDQTEEDNQSWPDPDEFDDMKKAEMQDTLKDLGLDDDISLSENKPVLSDYYEECWTEKFQ